MPYWGMKDFLDELVKIKEGTWMELVEKGEKFQSIGLEFLFGIVWGIDTI